jgi:hypothetical protein
LLKQLLSFTHISNRVINHGFIMNSACYVGSRIN